MAQEVGEPYEYLPGEWDPAPASPWAERKHPISSYLLPRIRHVTYPSIRQYSPVLFGNKSLLILHLGRFLSFR